MPSAATLADWDALAKSLGDTPHLDENGLVVPLGKVEEARPRYYVVWHGRAVGIFLNWGLTHAMVNGFKGAVYKKYQTLEGAQAGWHQGPGCWRDSWTPPSPRRAIPTPTPYPGPNRSPRQEQQSAGEAAPPEETLAAAQSRGLVQVHLSSVSVEGPPSDDEDQYWSDPSPEFLDDTRHPIPPPSPSASSSDEEDDLPPRSPSPSVMTATSLSSGTLSPRTIRTPLPSSPAVSISPMSVTRVKRNNSATIRTTTPELAAAASREQSRGVPVAPAKEAFVVVRGDRPGVYFDRNTAMFMLGTNPGMKLVRFHSYKKASWYFVQEYMAGRVGVPTIVSESSHNE
ncbi:hypothetical protein FKP32DRAFT_1562202 [Trametes sanguinea]|nr:hypothetical protein FKP32DRAFT_1562202 [Trametes sanguinea]